MNAPTQTQGQLMEEMLVELHKIGQYYFKGLGNALSELKILIGTYGEDCSNNILTILDLMTIYNEIPFGEMQKNPACILLTQIKTKIHQLRIEVGKILEQEDDADATSAIAIIMDIISLGRQFKDKLKEMIKFFRQLFTGYESYCFNCVDIYGNEWHGGDYEL